MNIKVIYDDENMSVKNGKVYWMPSGLVQSENNENAYMPHRIGYQGRDVSKVRIQPCFNGKNRLAFSKVSLYESTEINGHSDYAPFKSVYLCSAKVRELREFLKSSPWASDNNGVTRTYDFYERWLYDILHTLPGT